MKNLWLILVVLYMSCVTAYAQEWIPMVSNTTAFVPYNYSITNYYTEWRRVDVPLVKYYQIRQEPMYAPTVYFVQPGGSCFWWNNRPYYIVYPNNVYQYVPAKY